jgi:peptidoglycan/LPS O-acetylase OafA/YrhL
VTPTYRADIDGLRAIAVLSVLLFHAGVEVFSGGFVGVDIFFVISGYLITTIIHREVESGRFSIAHFYERRFRRILPAAAVVVVAVFVAGELLFPLHHQDNLARSAVAAALFSSNIYFYLESGYFADPANTMPLLHTWSLAVEEQFYVVFPLVMLSIAKFGRGQYAIWLPVLAVASLITCVVVTGENATAAFYLGHTRAWELLAGSLLAVNVFPALKDQHTREFVALAGALMLAFSVLFFSELTIFPGLAALLPVLGTVMIIHSGTGGETVVGRCLSTRPLVFVGLISFSLYLWHWPIVVFAQYYSVVALTPALIILVLCASFFLAVVSWRYVEMPFRKKRIAAERRQMFRVSAALTFVLVTIGAVGIYGQGVPGGDRPNAGMQFENDDPEWLRWQECEKRSLRLGGRSRPCVIGSEAAVPSFILWGDSHATALASAVDRSAARSAFAGEIITAAGCPPISRVVREGRRYCDEFNTDVLEYLEVHDEITTVIMSARWAYIVSGHYDQRKESYALRLIDLLAADPGSTDNTRVLETGLRRTVEQLQDLGKDVVLVGPVPEIGYDVPAATFVALKTKRDVDALISPTVSEHEARNSEVTEIFEMLEDDKGVSAILYPSDYLCNSGRCRVAMENVPLYRDDNHLSTSGSKYLSSMFDEVFGRQTQSKASAEPGKTASPDNLQGAANL